MMRRRWSGLVVLSMVVGLAVGCSDNESAAEREAKIRAEASKAVEKIKPELKQAGRDIKAAAEGAKEGWEHSGAKPLNLNTATVDELASLPGIGKGDARRIIGGRPYRERHELVTKKILTEGEYDRIREHVVAK